jgi:hypothetical protein
MCFQAWVAKDPASPAAAFLAARAAIAAVVGATEAGGNAGYFGS